jgi:four helix bundle protein
VVSGENGVIEMDETRFKLDDFELYKQAREFRKKVYRLIRLLPPEERFCLAKQMRAAALSVSNNIAEGHGRWHYRENVQFCRISRGSIEEIIDDLNTCTDESYEDPALFGELRSDAYTLIWKVNSYIAYLRKSEQGRDG